MRFSPGCSCCGGIVVDCCSPSNTLAATLYGTVTATACSAFTVGQVIPFTYVGFYNVFSSGAISYHVWVMGSDVSGCTSCERLAVIFWCGASGPEWRLITVGLLSGGLWFRESETCPVQPGSNVVACGADIYPTAALTITGNATSGCCVGQAVSLTVDP